VPSKARTIVDASGTDVSVAALNLPVDFRVAKFQIVFQLFGVHDTDDRNPVLFQDEILPANVGTLGHLAEIDPSLADWQAIDRNNGSFSQRLCSLINLNRC
jgi:hypothetical protein